MIGNQLAAAIGPITKSRPTYKKKEHSDGNSRRGQPVWMGIDGETTLRMKDGLPKMKDLPKEMGGSGSA